MPKPELLKEVEEEVTTLLSKLIQFNTTNPPGNETEAAKFLAHNLAEDGFESEIFESAPNRGSVVTRLGGTGEKPRLMLLSHLDVVAANPKEWSVDPFGGVVKDGYVWGRGALDMKGMTAVEVLVLKLLKRNGVKLRGDVVLAATADEEMGGLGGADFLLQHHREKVFAEYVLNEGGGSSVAVRGGVVFLVQVAEKGLCWFRVRARGVPGHGSMPSSGDNAILRMNRVVERLGNYRGEVEVVGSMRGFLDAFAGVDGSLREPFARLVAHPEQSEEVLGWLEGVDAALADEIRPRLRKTFVPTMICGGVKENVIPSACEAVFDCRVLPGTSTADALRLVRELLVDVGLDKLSFETIQVQEASESVVDTPLYGVIKDVLGEFVPGCGVAPVLMTGGTDSRFFRRLGSVCYGFHPLRGEERFGVKPTRREHGIDERISVENLVFGVSVLYETVKRLMT